jgi:arabinogalactan endo-1,4-beta-galactosidase
MLSNTVIRTVAILIALCPSVAAQAIEWGADLSTLPALEYYGASYSRGGFERSALAILRSAGIDVVRMRLWHTPADPWQGVDSVVAFAERAHDLGFKLLLDIHYSDTWADPEHQELPAVWQSLDFPQLRDSVYHYTNHVILRCRDAGALPAAVQIGNEIGGGMLWDWGRVGGAFDTPQQWLQLTNLLNAGIAGVRDSLPQSDWPAIIIHHQSGGDTGACQWFFDHLIAHEVPFDVIGISYYPWWHGGLDALSANLTALGSRYGRSVQIVETAYPWTTGWCDNQQNVVGAGTPLLPGFPATVSGQARFLDSLRQRVVAVPNLMNPLICLWEPAWIPTPAYGSPWENLALFDCNGNALEALDVFPGLAPQAVTLIREGASLRLRWHADANRFYRVYASESCGGPFNILAGATTDSSFVLTEELLQHDYRYYVVVGSPTP